MKRTKELPSTVTASTSFKTTPSTPYNCLDTIINDCPDESLEQVGTFDNISSFEDCRSLCDIIYAGVCNSYIYDHRSETCKVLKAGLEYYFPECGTFGAGYDTFENCLLDDVTYPDPCKVYYRVYNYSRKLKTPFANYIDTVN